MLIAAAPIVIPVSTAHPPTEAVATEAAKKVPVPAVTASTNNQNTRNSTENHEQPKNTLDLNRSTDQNKIKDEQQSKSDENSSEQQAKQEEEQQQQQQKQELAQQAQNQRTIEQLKNIDREVRAHEAAHASVGGQLAGAPQLDFTTGPDGKRYAVSGEVSINTSKVSNDPQATINKMSQVRNAALAPANPSSQDLKVAAIASQVSNQAQVEINIARNQESKFEKSANNENDPQATDNSEKGETVSKPREIIFANPIVARRSSFHLNQRIINSGALDDYTQQPQISHSA